ncbi:MAG: NADAR family protein [Pseudomonadota bacterium]
MDVFDKAALTEALRAGERAKYVFFWSHNRRHPSDAPGAEQLSQWAETPFAVDGVRYATAEHFMMAEKARLFGDEAALARILAAASPGAAKAFGREVRNFDQEAWEAAREDVVFRGSLAKAEQNQSVGAFLSATGARVLAEASPRDAIWGIGLAKDHADAERPEAWPGLNLLGFALMRARAALRERLG